MRIRTCKFRITAIAFALVAAILFYGSAYVSEEYDFAKLVIAQSKMGGGVPPMIFVKRIKSNYLPGGDRNSYINVSLLWGKGQLIISAKKQSGHWCAESAAYNGDSLNVLSCKDVIGKDK